MVARKMMKYISCLLVSFTLLLGGCGGSDTDHSSGTGSIAFGVNWQGAPTLAPSDPEHNPTNAAPMAAPLDCAASGVNTVSATVYNSTGTAVALGGPWNCSAHIGTVNNIPAGSSLKFVVTGNDTSGNVLYRGEQTGVTITAGQTTNVGAITAIPVTGTTSPPAAPTGVAATAGDMQNTITWTAVSSATSYNIYWSTTPGVTVAGTKITGAVSPYVHSPLTNGTMLYYIVTAVNLGGESLASTQVNATPTTAQVPPSTPIGVSATAGNGQNTITWTAVNGATSYNIYWSTTPVVTITTGTKITGATSPYSHTGLTNGATIYYIVTAVNLGGESSASSQVSAMSVPPVPSAPTGVSATAGDTQNTISWTAVNGATSYNIYWSTTAGVTTTTGTKITGAASPYNHIGLTNGTTYYYIVTAANLGGESLASSQVSAMPLPSTPAAPTPVSASAGDGQSTITWTASIGATSYNIYWSTTPGVTTTTGTKITGAASPYNHIGLTNGTTYYYIVTAANLGGESAASAQVSAVVPTLSAPTGVSATPGDTQNTISWTSVSGATSYNIYYGFAAGVTPATGTKITGTTSPYTHTGLANGTTIYYIVTAVNLGGESAASAQVSATTLPPPSAPTDVSATAGDTQNTITWTAVTGATSYNIYWSTTPGVTTTGTKITGATSPYIHTPLTNGTTYYYIVTAENSGGESAASSQVTATPQTSATFGAATNFTAGTGPNSVAIGDLNDDGKPDLAVANGTSNNVSILLGTGTGSLGPATNFTAGTGPYSVAIGDLNGDGKPDLAVANYGGNNISVLLGTGTGTFGAATNFTAGNLTVYVAIGDLNGDGKPDLAVANQGSDNISVLLGTGTGSFGAATNFTVGTNPRSVAIGDLNGDGKPDLVVANYVSNNISVLLGDGAGTFGVATNFTAGSGPYFVAVGDLNRDGRPDLAVANNGGGNVSVLLGTGTGSFGAATNFTVGMTPRSLAIGDLNGDGNPDLAVANYGGNISILLGTATGSFGAATNFTTGTRPTSVAIGDLNSDGKPDLAGANQGSGNVSVLLNSTTFPSSGSFGAATNFTAGTSARSVAGGDLNGDGKPDLAVANDTSNTVSILLGTGTGSFGAATNFAVGTTPISVAIGDLNGDGKPDLAVANNFSDNVSILFGTGAGAFGAATNYTAGGFPYSIAVGDLNGDGRPDLAVANNGSNTVSILLGTGTGSFGAATNYTVGTKPNSVAIGDLNGDGKLDLAVVNDGSNNVSILLGTGTGSFGAATNFTAGTVPISVVIGDINGDGKPDIAVANWFGTSNIVSILLGTGTGSFGAATNLTVGTEPNSVAIGDLNADGKPDLAVSNWVSGSVSILLGTGTGSFGAATNFTAGTNPISVAVGDLNGDGKPDLAVANNGGNVSVLLNQ